MCFFTHRERSVPCGAGPYDPGIDQQRCVCGAGRLARYALAAARQWTKESLAGRRADMWRYRELMPLFDGEQPVSLGEGWTPLIHARRLGARLGLSRVFVKDESLNPTNSFKARDRKSTRLNSSHLVISYDVFHLKQKNAQ